MADYHFLAPHKIKIKRREGALVLKLDGQCLKLSAPRRATPLSAPDEFIMLSNEEGDELGIVRRLSDLEPNSRALLEEELYQRYRTIIIERVLSVKRDPISGLIRWAVEVEGDGEDEPQLAAGLRPSLGVRLLQRARAKSNAESADENSESALPGEVTTGREVVFHIAGTEDVQNARYPRIFIGDTQGRRYEIPDCEELDLNSRRLGERYF